MCAGPKPARTGEQSIGTLCPRKQTSETVCDAVLSECESTRPSNPRTQTSPRGEFAPVSASALSSWTDVCKALCWWVWDLELGGAPHPSWVPRSSGCKNLSSSFGGTRSTAPFSSRQPISCLRAWAFRGDVRDCTTPLKRVVCVWIEAYIPLYHHASQREIPGITFHTLMNWHSGFSGLVVGCAAITCVGGGPALLWGGARGAAFIEWGGESSFCENVCIFIEWTPNTHIWATELLALGSWAVLALSSCPPIVRKTV